MNTSSQVDRPSALVKLFISRLSTTLSIAGLVAAATVAGLASGAEVILIASAPTAVAQYASAEQRMATIEFFDNYDATARRELQKVARYPNKSEARNQRLEGKVGVAFEVNNRGDLRNQKFSIPRRWPACAGRNIPRLPLTCKLAKKVVATRLFLTIGFLLRNEWCHVIWL
jgi:hypothetical protein